MDGTTNIAVGGTTPESTVVFKATLSDPTNDQVKLQIELRRLGEFSGAFTGNFTHESGFVICGAVAHTPVTALSLHDALPISRAVDNTTRASAWVSFGGN